MWGTTLNVAVQRFRSLRVTVIREVNLEKVGGGWVRESGVEGQEERRGPPLLPDQRGSTGAKFKE